MPKGRKPETVAQVREKLKAERAENKRLRTVNDARQSEITALRTEESERIRELNLDIQARALASAKLENEVTERDEKIEALERELSRTSDRIGKIKAVIEWATQNFIHGANEKQHVIARLLRAL